MHKIIMLELEYGALYSSYTGMYRTVDRWNDETLII